VFQVPGSGQLEDPEKEKVTPEKVFQIRFRLFQLWDQQSFSLTALL
jgi:hypothetical protein